MFIILFFMFGFCDSCLEKEQVENNTCFSSENVKNHYDVIQNDKLIKEKNFSFQLVEDLSNINFISACEDKVLNDHFEIKTKDESNYSIFIRVFLPQVVLINSKFLIDEDIDGYVFKIIDYLFYNTTISGIGIDEIENKFLTDEKLCIIKNVDIYSFNKKETRNFANMFCVFFWNEQEEFDFGLPLFEDDEIPKQKCYKCECILVRKSFIGWAFYIHIYGKECEKIKYLKISFNDKSFIENFCFKMISNNDDEHTLKEINDIWMVRNNKIVTKKNGNILINDEIVILSESAFIPEWMYKEGFDIFEQLEDINILPQQIRSI